jgi:hypothetical protein
MHSKLAIEKVTRFFMSLPQIGKGRRHLLQITSMNGKAMNASLEEGLNANENL